MTLRYSRCRLLAWSGALLLAGAAPVHAAATAAGVAHTVEANAAQANAVEARAAGARSAETNAADANAADAQLTKARAVESKAAEAEAAVLARAVGPNVVRLKADSRAMRDIMRRALDFGVVTARTGNAAAVLERTGVATRVEAEGLEALPDVADASGSAAVTANAGGRTDVGIGANAGARPGGAEGSIGGTAGLNVGASAGANAGTHARANAGAVASAMPMGVGSDAGGEAGGAVGGYVGGDIDLRFNFEAWRHAFAVTEPAEGGGVVRSLRFFDAQGHAVHTLAARNEAAGGLFDILAQDFRAPDQRTPLDLSAAPPAMESKPDSGIDVRQFRQAWLAMDNPGQFGAIAAQFGVAREQALRLAPPGMARQLAPHAVCALLAEVAKHRAPVAILAGNAGVTQTYTGAVARVVDAADVADVTGEGACTASAPGFSLRLGGAPILPAASGAAIPGASPIRGVSTAPGASRPSGLGAPVAAGGYRSYAVRRAGVTSVELFTPDGEPAVTLFGLRGRGMPPPAAWEELVRALPGQPPASP